MMEFDNRETKLQANAHARVKENEAILSNYFGSLQNQKRGTKRTQALSVAWRHDSIRLKTMRNQTTSDLLSESRR